MAQVQEVLIIGGGIGGMSTAITLRRAGIDAEIVEIDPDWRVSGAGITISGPTLRAYKQLGVIDRIAREGAVTYGLVICRPDGTVVAKRPPEGREITENDAEGGIPRPVLHRILSETCQSLGTTVRLGVTFEAFEQDGETLDVRFTDGTTGSYDLAVGADGLFSKVREMIFPDAPAPEFNGQGVWRVTCPRPADVRCPHFYLGPGMKAGINPISEDEMYMFHLQHVPDNPWFPEEQWHEILAEQLRGFGGHIAEIRENLSPASKINYRPLEAILLPRPWYKGRVILIGDAAHATTPHLASGAGMAVEDALVLGEVLQMSNSVDEALEKFMERRFERCRYVNETSLKLGELEKAREPVEKQTPLMEEAMGVLAKAI